MSPSRPRSSFEAASARGPKTGRRTRAARIELGIFDEVVVVGADGVEFPNFVQFVRFSFRSILALRRRDDVD